MSNAHKNVHNYDQPTTLLDIYIKLSDDGNPMCCLIFVKYFLDDNLFQVLIVADTLIDSDV